MNGNQCEDAVGQVEVNLDGEVSGSLRYLEQRVHVEQSEDVDAGSFRRRDQVAGHRQKDDAGVEQPVHCPGSGALPGLHLRPEAGGTVGDAPAELGRREEQQLCAQAVRTTPSAGAGSRLRRKLSSSTTAGHTPADTANATAAMPAAINVLVPATVGSLLHPMLMAQGSVGKEQGKARPASAIRFARRRTRPSSPPAGTRRDAVSHRASRLPGARMPRDPQATGSRARAPRAAAR